MNAETGKQTTEPVADSKEEKASRVSPQKFLYPPVKRDDVTGYGQTITQRHPSITSEEIQALDTRDPDLPPRWQWPC